MLISCSFNSFSVFGHYISARLQIIWRPYLWLVWSFTPMVSFLEFSISNPVFPPLPPSFLTWMPPASFSIVTDNRFTRRHQCSFSAQTHFLLLTHRYLFDPSSLLACPCTHHPLASLLLCTNSSLNLSLFSCSKLSEIKYFDWSVNVKKHILYKRNCGLFTVLSVTNLKNDPLPKPTNRDDNSMLYPRLHSLLTICLSPQTWSFHQRQSLSTPVGPYTPQYSYPLRAPALDLVQSSTAQALCCRMTQPPPIL